MGADDELVNCFFSYAIAFARLIAWRETQHSVLNYKGMSAAYLWDNGINEASHLTNIEET